MKIILGTDFSDQANGAANVAASLAAHTGSPLTLVHAVNPGPIGFLEKPQLDTLRSHLQKKLEAEASRIRKAEVAVVDKLIVGSPHRELVATAQRTSADLIVVASDRKETPLNWLARSVSEKTAQIATVPTLIVREQDSLLAWTRGERPLRISVGYDFSASADAALHFAGRLRAIAPCLITVTYVSWPPNETMRYGVGGDTTNPGNTPEVQKLLERDLKEKCDAIFGCESVEIRVVPTWTREDTKLVESAIERQSDVIIVGTNQRTGLDRFWLGSVSRGIVRHAPMNVICVPLASANEGSVSEHAPVRTFKRVLVPIDFSEPSLKAIPLALNAVQGGGEMRLLHVVKPRGGVRSQERRIRGHRMTSEKLHTLVPTGNRKVRKRAEVVEHQHPSVAIFQAAERFGADLICMGSQKKKLRSLKKRLVGSITRSVMRRSSRPVIIVQS